MLKHVLSSIDGVGSFGAAAVLLFFFVFISVLVRLMLFTKSELDELSALPLDQPATAEKEIH